MFGFTVTMNRTPADSPCNCPEHKKESVLTFDGGGIRGLVSLLILKALLLCIRDVERRRMRQYANGSPSNPNNGDENIPLACEYFSFMFGTSTGGILAIMLGRLRMNIKDCIKIYRTLGAEVFSNKQPFRFLGQNKYDCIRLERVIKDVARGPSGSDEPNFRDQYFANARDGESEEARIPNRILPCRVGAFTVQTSNDDDVQQKLHLFRSYINPTAADSSDRNKLHLNLDNQTDAKIWKIARATSAAPTYFRSMTVNGMKCIDGGILANNPSKYAWAEASSVHRNHPAISCQNHASSGGIRFLISIGTGKQADQRIRNDAGPIPLIRSLIKRGIKSMTDPEPDHNWMEADVSRKGIYHRFNVEKGLEKMKLDEWNTGKERRNTYDKIHDAVIEYVEQQEVRGQLQALAKRLVEHRRQRLGESAGATQNLRTPERRFDDQGTPGDLFRRSGGSSANSGWSNMDQIIEASDSSINEAPGSHLSARRGSSPWPYGPVEMSATSSAPASSPQMPIQSLSQSAPQSPSDGHIPTFNLNDAPMSPRPKEHTDRYA